MSSVDSPSSVEEPAATRENQNLNQSKQENDRPTREIIVQDMDVDLGNIRNQKAENGREPVAALLE